MKVIILIISLVVICSCNGQKSDGEVQSEPTYFKQAQAVWAKGRETEMNLTLGFRGSFMADRLDDPVFKITGSSLYRVFINGNYLGYGPARASHGYYRTDEYNLTPHLKKGTNFIAVEVVGYNVNSFYTLDQPSFLQAELRNGDEVILATGANSQNNFEAIQLDERVQKVRRYSTQRPFLEYYKLSEDADHWRNGGALKDKLELDIYGGKKLLSRNLKYPDFRITRPKEVIQKGTIALVKPEKYQKKGLGKFSEGFPEEEHSVSPSLKMQEIVTETLEKKINKDISQELKTNEFYTVDLGTNLSGFIGSKIICTEPSTIYFTFDEVLFEGEVKPKKRMPNVNNVIGYELEPGTYDLESFETYTFRYLQLSVTKGSCKIQDVYMREYAYPLNETVSFESDDDGLNKIFEASKQTFRQNSVDLFMDCPSRERAGWLCDSRFSSIVEKEFTGRDDIAYNYYENYALYTPFENLPEGMIPMVYPADIRNGNFIPNWALWFIIQVKEYADRGGDSKLVHQLKPRIMGIIDYFSAFENENGLLEELEGWKFIEWSKANNFVNGVNYPTNALYSRALSDVSDLYGDSIFRNKAQKIKQTILKQSFNGEFFVDNAVRDNNGNLIPTSNISEVGQYYAFFFDIATPEAFPDLWDKLTLKFGPNRNDKKVYPRVFKANAFIGNYLRMEMLYRYGRSDQMLKEMKGYFLNMANLTGTLWEHMDTHASCNHGFASYLGHLLFQGALGVQQIDYPNKEVRIRFENTYLKTCEGVIPVGDEKIRLKWKKSGNRLQYSLELPKGFTAKIQNPDGLEITKQN